MQSTLTPEEADPHDIFVIEPQILKDDYVVLAARGDKPSSVQTSQDKASANPAEDILGDLLNRPAKPKLRVAPDISVVAPVPSVKPLPPPVDTKFRATAATADAIANDIKAPGDIKVPDDIRLNGAQPSRGAWAKRALVAFLFALGSVAATQAWDHYGDAARQMIAEWTPAFTLPSLQPAATAAAAAQPASSAVQTAVTDQTPSPPAPAAVQPAPDAAPAATASETAAATTPPAATQSAQALQSMTQDLAAMGQQIEQLKASIAQLKAGQEQMAQQISRDVVRNAVARNSEVRTSEVRNSELRSRLSAMPPRPVRKPPRAAYSAAPTAAAYNVPPPQPAPAYPTAVAPAPMQVPQVTTDPDGDLVVRPPMPLR